MKQIPNIFTLLNLFFGCMAIVVVLQPGLIIRYDPDGTQLVDMPEKIWMASLFIGIAAIIDFLDGFVARLLKASSELGKQLDSLADVVSFGVAPSMILYQFLRLGYAQQEDGLNISVAWLAPVFILACAAAFRLGTFNLDTEQQYGFRGVPTPAVGLLVASFPLIYWNQPEALLNGWLLKPWFIYSLVFVLSALMVSRIPLLSLKFREKGFAANLPKWILAGISLLSAVFMGWQSVPVVFIAYILLSLAFKKQAL